MHSATNMHRKPPNKGKNVLETEIVPDLPAEEYHADKRTGSTTTKMHADENMTPADIKLKLENNKETDAMALGTAIHVAILEPEKYDSMYLEQPENWGKLTEGTGYEKWSALKKKAKELGAKTLKFKDAQTIKRIMEAAPKSQRLQEVLSTGSGEVSAFAGKYKARADWITDDGFIWDVKSTAMGLDDETLDKEIHKRKHHVGAAHYIRVFEQAGVEINGFGWIFVSTGPIPHIRLKTAPLWMLGYGLLDLRRAMAKLETTQERDEHPGWPDEITEADLPYWAKRRYENE